MKVENGVFKAVEISEHNCIIMPDIGPWDELTITSNSEQEATS